MDAADTTDPVEDILEHFGIKGMRWGTRKERTPIKSISETHTFQVKSGETVTLEGQKTSALGRTIARVIPPLRDKINNSDLYSIKNSSGKKVGELYTSKDHEEKNALNVVWVETDKTERGKGYATGVMKKVIEVAKRDGRDKVTLEVPGSSPDAKHIYEKLGFKDKGGYKDYDPNDIWGGLTRMELSLKTTTQAQHSADDILEHFGIKGMKWGRRNASTGHTPIEVKTDPNGQIQKVTGGKHAPASEDALRVAATRQKAKKSGPNALSTKELQDLVTRMNLEQQYSGLRAKEPTAFKKGMSTIKTVLSVGKTGQEVFTLFNSPAGKKAMEVGKSALSSLKK